MPDNLLLRHFWLLFLAVMLLNVAIWRRRLNQLVETGRASEKEVADFLRGAIIGVTVLAFAGEAIVLASGWRNPLCFYVQPWTDPGVIALWTIQIVTWGLLLWWLWVGRGAETLARLGPALGRGRVRDRPYTLTQVRVVGTAIVIIAAAIGVADVAQANTATPSELLPCISADASATS